MWCNPPYGRQIDKWVQKASYENAVNNNTIVMLLPARTDTRWFHTYIYKQPNVDIRFVRGRLKFGDSKNRAPFPSMVVIFKPKRRGGVTMDLLCILAIYMAALICIVLTLFTSVVLYEFLAAAYDVVSGWIHNLKWKRRYARRRRK